VVQQNRDVVIEAGQEVHSAVAVNGNVVVRAGAVVDGSAMAIHGSVTLEPGAVVKRGVLAINGSVAASGDARVGEDVIALGGSASMGEGVTVGGSRLELALNIDGTELAQTLVNQLLGPKGHCEIEESSLSASPDAGAAER
jgi:hypothetical protein